MEEIKRILLKDPECKALWDTLESCLPTESEIDSYIQDNPEDVLKNLKEQFLDAEETILECIKLKLKVIITMEALTDSDNIERTRFVLSRQLIDQYNKVKELKQALKADGN